MTTMLEKAAMAACEAGVECGLRTNDGSALWDEVAVHYVDIARAVLMAVREGCVEDGTPCLIPMLRDAYFSRMLEVDGGEAPHFYHCEASGFTAMIDAILAEPNQG